MRVIFCFIFLIIVAGCSNNARLIEKNSYSVVVKNFRKIYKKIFTLGITNLNNEPTLYFVNSIDSNIYFYNIFKPSSAKTYSLKNTLKKNIIEKFNQWCIVSPDSIFAISRYNECVYLFNLHDEIIDSFPLFNNKYRHSYVFISYLNHEMLYHKNKLIIPVTNNVYEDKEKNEYFKTAGITIDLSTKQITQYGITSKRKLYNGEKYADFYNYTMAKNNQLFFHYGYMHSIYQYDLKNNDINYYYCKSKNIDTFNAIPDSLIDNYNFRKDYMITEPRYRKMQYYKQLDCFYKLIKLRAKYTSSTGFYKQKPQLEQAIMILDTNLNILNEIVMDNDNYFISSITTNNGILFFQKQTQKNSDTLCFKLYDIAF